MYREVIIFSRWQNFPLPSRSVPPRFAVRIRAVALSQFVQLGDHLFAERGRLQHFQVLAESQYLCDQPPSRGQARFCYDTVRPLLHATDAQPFLDVAHDIAVHREHGVHAVRFAVPAREQRGNFGRVPPGKPFAEMRAEAILPVLKSLNSPLKRQNASAYQSPCL